MQFKKIKNMKLKIYSVAESARNLPLAMRNNRNRYYSDEFSGLSPEEKLLKTIFRDQENLAAEPEVLPKSELPAGNIPQGEAQFSKDIYSGNSTEGNIKEAEDASDDNTSEIGYRNNRKILRKKKYSAISKQDIADLESYLDTNENFSCDYSSVRNSLLRSR